MDMWAGDEAEQSGAATRMSLKLGRHFLRATVALEKLERLTLSVPSGAALALQTAFEVHELQYSLHQGPALLVMAFSSA